MRSPVGHIGESPVLAPFQHSFDELNRPLRQTTFVVVDLETTGGSHHDDEITEIGAVKVQGGLVLAEFATLVRPERPIPAFISVLTGITDSMVSLAPPLAAVLPAFLEFTGSAVVVAHNAPFDLSFLRAGCARLGIDWPGNPVLDTVALARRALDRDEAPNCKLSTLARLFSASTMPNHRALCDARATVDVLHGLLERVAGAGVESWDELRDYATAAPAARRHKRHLAQGLPEGPGVYTFRDADGRPLYIGTSRDVRSRVRQYFTGSERRSRMTEMVSLADHVSVVPCDTVLEAQVREVRLLAEHRPRYNRRSTRPERVFWLTMTEESFPRLSVVRSVADRKQDCLGPFASQLQAQAAMTALQDTFGLRRCTQRLSTRRASPSCLLADLARCGAPCQGRLDVEDHRLLVQAVLAAMTADCTPVLDWSQRRLDVLEAQSRFEDASTVRDRAAALVRALARQQELAQLAAIDQIVAASPQGTGGWDVCVVRHGRLAGSTILARGGATGPVIHALTASAQRSPDPQRGPDPQCDHGPRNDLRSLSGVAVAEVALVHRWLTRPGVRLIELDGTWSSPATGAARHQRWLRSPGASGADHDRSGSISPLRRSRAPLTSTR